MLAPLDELYFKWLYGCVESTRVKDSSKTYWSLLQTMHKTEFVWFVPNDDNRILDATDLRYLFLEYIDDTANDVWMQMGASFLEVIVALVRRLEFETGDSTSDWFWELMGNLGVQHYNDRYFDERVRTEVESILDEVIWRTYGSTGRGGLFPLKEPKQDQRNVELWYQASAYILEKG